VQLIGRDSWDEFEVRQSFLRSAEGLKEISAFIDGIGPWIPYIIDKNDFSSADISVLASRAKALGLFIHAFTLRSDELPRSADNLAQTLEFLVRRAGLDGLFTDQPDEVLRYLNSVN
jgi:glycerophosphoryl diester phosphodiesterase